MNIRLRIVVWTQVFSSLACITGRQIAGTKLAGEGPGLWWVSTSVSFLVLGLTLAGGKFSLWNRVSDKLDLGTEQECQEVF